MSEKKMSSTPAEAEPRVAKQVGEGSYEGTRDYQKSIKTYLDDADVGADARAARPADDAEADELKRAEDEGKSHSKAKGS